MADVHARVPDALLEAARSATGLPAGASGAQVARASMAAAAGWPSAAVTVAAGPRGDAAQAEGQAG